MWIRETDARWIWPAALGDGPNQYAEFRHEFDLESSRPGAELIISADSNYAVWLNGAFLDCGQYPDVPPRRTCDRLPAGRLLKSGRNVLVIGVHYHPDGAPHENTARVLKFGRQLRGRFRLPVYEVDERYSTTEALASGAKDADAASACIILEQFLRSLP